MGSLERKGAENEEAWRGKYFENKVYSILPLEAEGDDHISPLSLVDYKFITNLCVLRFIFFLQHEQSVLRAVACKQTLKTFSL